MKRRYCVIFIGLIKEEEHFISEMSGLGVDSATAALILKKAPIILKADMSLEEAMRYAGAINKAGGRVRIKEDGDFRNVQHGGFSMKIMTFENFFMCPQCGHKQLKEPSCKRCGHSFT